LAAVHAIAGHAAFFSPSIARRILDSAVVDRYSAYTDALSRFAPLTPRAQETLIWLTAGSTNAARATDRQLAARTVSAHVSSIITTTGARNRAEAALIAIRARRV